MTQEPGTIHLDIYALAREGFRHEIGNLIAITRSPAFRDLLPAFLDYRSFLGAGSRPFSGDAAVSELLQENRRIDAADCPEAARKLFQYANLAACCEIFSGWTIPVAGLEMARTGEYLETALANAGMDREALGRNMAQRLNNGDTVRVVQALKLLGLLEADTASSHQLSLGASIGRRDCHAMHLEPVITPAGPFNATGPLPPLRFQAKAADPADIILMDNDTAMEPVYARLYAGSRGRVSAMVTDLYDGLGALAGQVARSERPPRTLVVAFRIEPGAFADPGLFLDSIGRVIADSADLVMTIGSGDTTAAFSARKEVMKGLTQQLSERGMNPCRIKYYRGEGPGEQRAGPVFGLNQYASYETLYCRLEKRKLTGNRQHQA